MSPRITNNVRRPSPVTILVNGRAVSAYEGESLATALMASGTLVMRRDAAGQPRAPFCNMGICFDCLVTVQETTPSAAGLSARRVRACLAEVRAGLSVTVADP